MQHALCRRGSSSRSSGETAPLCAAMSRGSSSHHCAYTARNKQRAQRAEHKCAETLPSMRKRALH